MRRCTVRYPASGLHDLGRIGMALGRLTKLGAAVAAGAAAVLLVPSVAWANTTPSLLAGQTGKDILASDGGFNKQGSPDCTGITHSATEDVWVFNWPGGGPNNNAGDLVNVTIGWDNTGDHTADVFKSKSDGTLTSDNGTLKWYVITPHGWRLEAGVSEVTGQTSNGSFVLTHTCAGTQTPPTTTSPGGGGGGGGGDGDGDGGSSSSSSSSNPGTPTPPGGGGGNLPTTGVAIGGIVAAGLGLIAGGTVLMLARRRRDATDAS